jgi:hypothetical protein
MKVIKHKIQCITVSVLLVIFSGFIVTASAGTPNGANLLVQFKGEGSALPIIPDEIMAALPAAPILCLKMPMIDPRTGWQVGNGYDCVIELGFDPAMGGGGPVRTAYVLEFVGRGMLVTDSHIAVQPNEWDAQSYIDLGGGALFPVTHMISDMPVAPEQNIFSGTRGFASAAGRVRVSGGNNLERLGLGIIVFDYLVVVEFD